MQTNLEPFQIRSEDFEPAYMKLFLQRGALPSITPRVVFSGKLQGMPKRLRSKSTEQSVCKTGRQARVVSYAPHHGEEDCLRGSNGSGTIFSPPCVT